MLSKNWNHNQVKNGDDFQILRMNENDFDSNAFEKVLKWIHRGNVNAPASIELGIEMFRVCDMLDLQEYLVRLSQWIPLKVEQWLKSDEWQGDAIGFMLMINYLSILDTQEMCKKIET